MKFKVSSKFPRTGTLHPSQKSGSQMECVTQMKSPFLECSGREPYWVVTRLSLLKLSMNISDAPVSTKTAGFKSHRCRQFTRQRSSSRSFAEPEAEYPLLTSPDLMHKLWSVQLALVHAQFQLRRTTQFAIHQAKFPQVAQLLRSGLSQTQTTPTLTAKLG